MINQNSKILVVFPTILLNNLNLSWSISGRFVNKASYHQFVTTTTWFYLISTVCSCPFNMTVVKNWFVGLKINGCTVDFRRRKNVCNVRLTLWAEKCAINTFLFFSTNISLWKINRRFSIRFRVSLRLGSQMSRL